MKSSKLNNWLRYITVFLSIVAVICIIIHYNYKLSVIKFRDNRMDENVTLCSTGLWKNLAIEVIINLFVCPPSVDFKFEMT